MPTELEHIKERYARRATAYADFKYDPVNPAVYMSIQERERVLMRWIRCCGIAPLASRRLLEIGCGSGHNLLDFLRIGFQPDNLTGNDLLPDRVEYARRVLPAGVRILPGDAMDLQLPAKSFAVVRRVAV